MESDPEEQDIIKLLAKLKNTGGNYPEEMLAAQRQTFLRRMAEIELGLSPNLGKKNPVKNAKTPKIPATARTFLEGSLIIAIIAEAGMAAYIYRDKLASLFQSITATQRVQAVTPLPVVPTSLGAQEITPSPALTSTLPSATVSASATGITGTPMPDVVNNNGGGDDQITSTPAQNGNNGNHYGETPKPERTKQPGGNDNTNQDKKVKPTKSK